MHIAIKNPAISGPDREKTGDYHFGASLRRAFEAEGVRVTEHYWPDWSDGAEADVALVLRGRYRYRPRPGQFTVLWAISHPAAITPEEIDAFDLAYLGSETHARMMAGPGRPPLSVLRQCSDFAGPGESPGRAPAEREGTVFVGNSRGVFRDIVRWSVAAGARPALYGRGWDTIGLGRLVVADYVDNAALPGLYSRTRLGLNDHWNDMRYFGYINNRLFDSLFCGQPTLSDWFPELEETFGDALVYARDGTSFRKAFEVAGSDYDALVARARDRGRQLARDYTFAARARRILDDIETFRPRRAPRPALPPPVAPETVPAFAAIAAEIGRREAKERRYVLLVHPGPAGTAGFSGRGISLLTAGLGPGPWEVGLEPDVAAIAHRKFDAVVVESLSGRDPGTTLSPRTLRLLRRLTRRNGWFVAPAADGKGYATVRTGRRLIPHPRLRRRLALGWQLR